MGASSSKAKSKRRQQPLHAPKGYPPYDYRYEQGYPPPWPQGIPSYPYGHPALMPSHPVIPPGFFPPQYPVQMPQPHPYQLPPQPPREPQPAPQTQPQPQQPNKRKKTRRGPATATIVFGRRDSAQAAPTNSAQPPVVPPPPDLAPRVSTSTRVSTGPPPSSQSHAPQGYQPPAENHGQATPAASRPSHERRASLQATTSQRPIPPAAPPAPLVSSDPAPIDLIRLPEPLPSLPVDVYLTSPFRHLLEPLPGQSEETIVANEEEPKEEPKKQKRGLFGALAGQKSGQKETNKASDYLTQPKPTVVDVRHFTNFTPASRAPYLPPPPPKNTAPQPPKTATTPHAAATLHMASSPVPRSPSHSVAPLGGEEPALKPIYFNQTTEGYTDFLNHSPHRVWLERVEYPTAAHLLQALQFLPHHPDIAESIRLTEDIVDAYQVSVQYSDQIEPGFAESILENTETVALLKFHQHGGLRDMLIETYPVPLIYDDPSDYYWGTGVGPEGEPFQNQLGGVLERIRERMIQESRR